MAYEIWHMAKVLHGLDHSLPYSSGYSFRSDYVIGAQRRLGLHPVVITSPKREDFEHGVETVDGVDYHRLRWPGITAPLRKIPLLNHSLCLVALTKEIKRLAEALKVDLIHFVVAAALFVAMLVFYRVAPTWRLFYVAPLVAIQVAFTTGGRKIRR